MDVKTIKIPVIFHNLRGNDSHFIMHTLVGINNIMLGKHLVFLGTFQFMSSSLDRLVSTLPDDALKYTGHVLEEKKKQLI